MGKIFLGWLLGLGTPVFIDFVMTLDRKGQDWLFYGFMVLVVLLKVASVRHKNRSRKVIQ